MFAKSSQWYKFCLPAGFEITLPEDAQYIYIGTFEYDLDYALCPVGFEHLDDYEYAQKLLNRDIGKEVKLYRAPLKLEEKAEK